MYLVRVAKNSCVSSPSYTFQEVFCWDVLWKTVRILPCCFASAMHLSASAELFTNGFSTTTAKWKTDAQSSLVSPLWVLSILFEEQSRTCQAAFTSIPGHGYS